MVYRSPPAGGSQALPVGELIHDSWRRGIEFAALVMLMLLSSTASPLRTKSVGACGPIVSEREADELCRTT